MCSLSMSTAVKLTGEPDRISVLCQWAVCVCVYIPSEFVTIIPFRRCFLCAFVECKASRGVTTGGGDDDDDDV